MKTAIVLQNKDFSTFFPSDTPIAKVKLARKLYSEFRYARIEKMIIAYPSQIESFVIFDRNNWDNKNRYGKKVAKLSIFNCLKCGDIGEINIPTYNDPAKVVKCHHC